MKLSCEKYNRQMYPMGKDARFQKSKVNVDGKINLT